MNLGLIANQNKVFSLQSSQKTSSIFDILHQYLVPWGTGSHDSINTTLHYIVATLGAL